MVITFLTAILNKSFLCQVYFSKLLIEWHLVEWVFLDQGGTLWQYWSQSCRDWKKVGNHCAGCCVRYEFSIVYYIPIFTTARGKSRGGDWGNRPPKTYESNIIHHDFLQFRKQHSRYNVSLLSIVLSQQCWEVYFITVAKLLWDFTKYYWNRPP